MLTLYEFAVVTPQQKTIKPQLLASVEIVSYCILKAGFSPGDQGIDFEAIFSPGITSCEFMGKTLIKRRDSNTFGEKLCHEIRSHLEAFLGEKRAEEKSRVLAPTLSH